MSGNSTIRALMQPVSDGVRAYFAPVDRTTEKPGAFDPAAVGLFNLDSPPAPWIDAGWVDNFVRTAQTKVEALRIGPDAAVNRQLRMNRGAAVELEFREWGKLQMALACGAQHMNVLADAGGATGSSSGGVEAAAVALQPGSTVQELMVGPAVAGFAVGDIVAVDLDYQQQTGYVGTGIAGAYVPSLPPLTYQPDYIRRITFNVGRVVAVTDHSLQLDAPLLGGAPASTACVQKVAAFVDREGGNFFQEWSALFVLPETSAGRVCFYYPRLQGAGSPREGALKLADPWRATTLYAAFEAMACQDAIDGETVYCYRVYFPPSQATLY
jgi:hypothetical protein